MANQYEPVTDEDRQRVRELHAKGLGRNEIARQTGRSQRTVSLIAEDLGLTFDRTATAVATQAKVADAKARRAAIVQRLYARTERLGLWYRRFIAGHWVQSEGAIYEMFDAQQHVVRTLPRIERWLCDSIDYGTVNPYADILLGLGTDRRLYVVSEYRHDSRTARRQMTDAEYSRARRAWLARVPQPETNVVGVQPEWTIVDPSASSYIEQLHRDGVTGVTAADNTVLDGIRTVSSLFSTGDLLVHESAQGLIDELPGYSWDDAAAERGEDRPIKENDHSCDALRYGVRTTLWRPYLPTRLEVAA